MGKILHKYKNSVIIIKMNAVIRVFYFRAKQKAFIQIPASNASREAVFEGAQYMCRAVHTRLVISSQFPEEAGLPSRWHCTLCIWPLSAGVLHTSLSSLKCHFLFIISCLRAYLVKHPSLPLNMKAEKEEDLKPESVNTSYIALLLLKNRKKSMYGTPSPK